MSVFSLVGPSAWNGSLGCFLKGFPSMLCVGWGGVMGGAGGSGLCPSCTNSFPFQEVEMAKPSTKRGPVKGAKRAGSTKAPSAARGADKAIIDFLHNATQGATTTQPQTPRPTLSSLVAPRSHAKD